MLNFLKTLVNVQTVDLEAKLFPTQDCTFGGKGEIELEAFHNGNAKMEIDIKHSGIPDGTPVEVVYQGQVVATVAPVGGYVRERLQFSENEAYPQFAVGESVEMQIGGYAAYSGTFRND